MADNDEQPLPLVAEGVSKRFGAVAALSNAALQVRRGEIVALMGANGAGKSTFIKILTGALKPDSGRIAIRGTAAPIARPAEARKAGLVPVYQEPSLIPDLTVLDNLRLCDTPAEPFRRWCRDLGLGDAALDAIVRHLPLASLRILDLARALAIEPEVLILDEMTAALPTDLVQRVLRVVRQQADAGRSVIYISHRFTEIAEICDRATVLRDGQTVGDLPITPGVEQRVVDLMLGGKAGAAAAAAPHIVRTRTDEPPRLKVRNLGTGSKLSDVSFDLHAGEVLGMVALEGQGQDELFDVLSGNRRAAAGLLEIDGRRAAFRHPADAIAAGVTFVPGDRARALFMQRPVRENIAIPALARPRNWGAIAMAAEAARVATAIERLQIDTRAQGEVRRLSGGNQQKVTVARWLAQGVQTLLLFDPTRGIDIRTKHQIYGLVRELAAQGAAVLFYTSELGEIPLACDRALAIFNGRTVGVFEAAQCSEETLLRAAYGLTGGKADAA